MRWGPYTVVSTKAPASRDTEDTWKVQILSHDGVALREIHGYNFAGMKVLRFGSHCNPILTLELGDGGNDGQDLIYTYSFSKSTGIKNLVATYGSLDDLEFKNLPAQDLPELIVDDSETLLQFDHFSRHALGKVKRVYEWNGDTYQNKTEEHPEITAVPLDHLRLKLLHSLPDAENYVRSSFVGGQEDSAAESREDVMTPFINYWANAIASGRAAEAEQLFRHKASPRLQAWLKSKHTLVLEALSEGHKNIRTDDSKLVGT